MLVHSPLVGALTWQPVAGRLERLGHHVLTPSLAGVFAREGPFRSAFASAAAEALRSSGAREAVLVVHSGAGTLLPDIAAEAEKAKVSVAGAVLVDAALPHPGLSWTESAPEELRDQVRAMAKDGFLPPWHEWFPEGTLEELLPDPGTRSRFREDVPRLPLAYLEEKAAALPGPDPERGAYLLLSPAYERQADEAGRSGFLVARREMHHLAPLTHPETVGSAVAELVGALLGRADRERH